MEILGAASSLGSLMGSGGGMLTGAIVLFLAVFVLARLLAFLFVVLGAFGALTNVPHVDLAGFSLGVPELFGLALLLFLLSAIFSSSSDG